MATDDGIKQYSPDDFAKAKQRRKKKEQPKEEPNNRKRCNFDGAKE